MNQLVAPVMLRHRIEYELESLVKAEHAGSLLGQIEMALDGATDVLQQFIARVSLGEIASPRAWAV